MFKLEYYILKLGDNFLTDFQLDNELKLRYTLVVSHLHAVRFNRKIDGLLKKLEESSYSFRERPENRIPEGAEIKWIKVTCEYILEEDL